MATGIGIVSRLRFFYDYAISTFTCVCGRLLPTLVVPRTDLVNKTAIVTGANSGLGLQLAADLVERKATVYLTCRNQTKADAAAENIARRFPGSQDRIKTILLDMSDLASVRRCAESWKAKGGIEIDILIHNAGIAAKPTGQEFSTDGFPIHYPTNLLGSFLLTHLLESFLAPEARVILTTSYANYGGDFSVDFATGQVKNKVESGFHCGAHTTLSAFDSQFYQNSKLMQAAFARTLQQKFDRETKDVGSVRGRTCHAFSPGVTATDIFGKIPADAPSKDRVFATLKAGWTIMATDVAQGAATGTWLACTDDASVIGPGGGGRYWDRMTRRLSRADLLSQEVLARLWTRWQADAGITWK